jgi:hypothetical protein
MATLNAIGSLGLLNLGTTLALGGHSGPAGVSLGLAALFAGLVLAGMKRVQRLDKFEKEIRS